MDLDLALLNDKSAAVTDNDSSCADEQKVPGKPKFVEERFRSAAKSLTGTLVAELTTMNFDGSPIYSELEVKANKFKKKKAHAKALQDARKEHKADTCRFCNKEGHYQKNCLKHKAWFEKKGTISAFGFLTIQITNPNKDFLFMGNRMEAPIEGYGYIYLLKSQATAALKVFVNEVERQLDIKVKIIRSDRGGEYYEKYNESGQCLGPFPKFLEERSICAQYTTPRTPQQNSVAERRNRTLMDMVRSMKGAKKVLRYLKETKDFMLMYRRSKHLEVVGYSDSNFVGCIGTKKSTFGYLFQLAEGAISWKSAKQSVIATSTTEAEFVACFEATIHALWLRNFIS
ncbi:PREDICTED: uncharacterized protein LOC109216520 [Nicotiana attenuata]|uniref:uncharacterized protein LOC109216520 n=1 Tax=Nicotiana attenuata TaxID=49451 RepID=UPI00090590FA|nr:PREDICTED: uncharacterized protein LOC109216520 [Nicotiana attenuata]